MCLKFQLTIGYGDYTLSVEFFQIYHLSFSTASLFFSSFFQLSGRRKKFQVMLITLLLHYGSYKVAYVSELTEKRNTFNRPIRNKSF